MAPIFKRHLGRPVKIRRVCRGGHDSIEDVIQHLVYEAGGLR